MYVDGTGSVREYIAKCGGMEPSDARNLRALESEIAEQRVGSEVAFYRSITAASGNNQFTEFIGMTEKRLMENLRSVVVKNAIAADKHRTVFDALLHSQPDTARNAARAHFEGAAKRLTDRTDIKDIERLLP